MYDNSIKDKFVELCAEGLNAETAAQQLNVGRSTAFNWARQFRAKIHNLKAMRFFAAREQILGSYEERLKLAVARLRKYEHEMDSRHPDYLTTKELIAFINATRRDVEKLSLLPSFIEEPQETNSDETATT
jgi:transposase